MKLWKQTSMLTRIVKRLAHMLGAEVTRLAKSPRETLLGIRNLPIQTVIDVGANTGQFASYVRRLLPRAHVYCFEPLPGAFAKLQQWAAGQRNVTVFNVALGESEATAEMFQHIDHDTSSSLLPSTPLTQSLYPETRHQLTIHVPVRTLDSVLAGVSPPVAPQILVKLDVQGYEQQVIGGGRKTLAQAKACILEVSVDELYRGQADFKRLLDALYDLGFRYVGNLEQNYARDGHVIFLDAVFLKP